ncbi:PQQ-like beta-propeller repeat protein [Erythrobacter sanguineus]|uniref:Outer membrane protein assembly factor BamB, contains PQQ-like beta-propeller repeat n=1 Tax=Erythrobacter sanguineus TaxID=198312 RepID=A0A1M7RQZ8_9SPHN|nr:PQQ-like beta-propeller repeat protein [Erythrobacter sanguineus]SHN48610.1 Outer membrane protein assembly factor BamB, contains PQQ-like beta-propeller repeat [Erythrobacter sanguineus]
MTHFRIARTTLLAGMLAVALTGCKGGLFGGKDEKTTPTIGNRTPILSRIESGAEVDPALAAISVVLPPARPNIEWAQVGGSASKSYGHLALADNPTKAWTAQISGSTNRERLAAAPVIGSNKLFAEGTDGVIHAFDKKTGERLWTRGDGDMTKDQRPSAFGGGVSYENGRIYATNGIGEVKAVNADTGEVIWKVTPAGPLRGSPTIAFGQLFVMTQDNQIVSLNIQDGSQIWDESGSTTQAGVFGVAAPSAGQGTVIAGYSSGELSAYRYENGRILWSDALARTSISTTVGSITDIDADPIIDSGRVYALGQGGRMAAYELVTGQRIWELNLAGISMPAIAGEWIFTLTDDARLLAIARSSGRVRWITQLQGFRKEKKKEGPIFWTGPVLAGGNLWVASSRGEVWKISASDGSAEFFDDIKQPVSLPPVVADNYLYILDDSGRIHAWR